MFGALRGAPAGRKIPFDRDGYTAAVEGRIVGVGVGKTIRIKSIHVKYELALPAESREATERALTLHPQGCPAHQGVHGTIDVTWEARVRFGDRHPPGLLARRVRPPVRATADQAAPSRRTSRWGNGISISEARKRSTTD